MNTFVTQMTALALIGLLAACSGGSGGGGSSDGGGSVGGGSDDNGSGFDDDSNDDAGNDNDDAGNDDDGRDDDGMSGGDDDTAGRSTDPVTYSGRGQVIVVDEDADGDDPDALPDSVNLAVETTASANSGGRLATFIGEARDENGDVISRVDFGPNSDDVDRDNLGELERVEIDDADIYIYDADGSEYAFQRFGAWEDDDALNNGSEAVVIFNTGDAISEAAQANAVYEGNSVGAQFVYGNDDNIGTLTTADVRIETDTVTATFQTRNTRLLDDDLDVIRTEERLDLDGDMSIDGGQFAGPVSGDAVQGVVDGRFYGPNAEEAGGTFGTTTNNGRIYNGSFGATR